MAVASGPEKWSQSQNASTLHFLNSPDGNKFLSWTQACSVYDLSKGFPNELMVLITSFKFYFIETYCSFCKLWLPLM